MRRGDQANIDPPVTDITQPSDQGCDPVHEDRQDRGAP